MTCPWLAPFTQAVTCNGFSASALQAWMQVNATRAVAAWKLTQLLHVCVRVLFGMQLQQRDNEIALLVNMLKGRGTTNQSSTGNKERICSSNLSPVKPAVAPLTEASDTAAAADGGSTAIGVVTSSKDSSVVLSALLDTTLLSDRHKAFEMFRQSYKQGQVGSGRNTCMY